MRTVELGATGLRASMLGFGCAPMGGRVSARVSHRALAKAYELGITFYDTARSYGYGESERILGRFLRGRRSRVVISTKCGIEAGKASWPKTLAKTIARPVLGSLPGLRSSLRGTLGKQHRGGRFAVEDIGRSIEQSLRELGTDYIDILFLHMPSPDVLEQDHVFELLDRLVQSGKLRAYGVSADHEVVQAFLRSMRGSAVQYAHNWLIGYPEAAIRGRSEVAAIGNQPFAGTHAVSLFRDQLREAARGLGAGDSMHELLRDPDATVLADLAFGLALRNTGTQVSVCSMFRDEHIHQNVAAIDSTRFSDADLARLRAFLGAKANGSRLAGTNREQVR